MLSRPEIKTAERLKGGAVAISRFGSASDFIVRYALKKSTTGAISTSYIGNKLRSVERSDQRR